MNAVNREERDIRDAMRQALCRRLRVTGLQTLEPPCDGRIVKCGICDRTVEAMLDAGRQALGSGRVENGDDV